jgi:hypothetical protein
MTRLFGPRIIVPAALVAVALTAAAGCQPQGGLSASGSSSASLSATHTPKPHHSQTPGGTQSAPATTPTSATPTPGAPTPGDPTPGTPAPGDPTSTSTPPTSSPSSTPPSGGATSSPPAGTHTCTTSKSDGNCGPYTYAGITNSNGYNTYVSNNCWADPSCKQTVTATDPGNWSVSANEPAGNGAVMTAPEVQQQFNNWCASAHAYDNRTSASCNNLSDTPISAMSQLTSSYTESTPHNSQTIAQWSWDMWLSSDSGYADEVMVWVDTNNRCNSGSFGTQLHDPVTIAGQQWTPHRYPNSSEFIWVLNGSGGASTCAQQPTGSVDLLALLKWMQSNGYASPSAAVSLVDGVWEICSTGGAPETFTVSKYQLTSS